MYEVFQENVQLKYYKLNKKKIKIKDWIILIVDKRWKLNVK